MTDRDTELDRYETELEHLRTENDQLRRSAQAFGELAERLNRALSMVSALHQEPVKSPQERSRAAKCLPLS